MSCLPTCRRYSSFMISEWHIWSHNSFSTSLVPRNLFSKILDFSEWVSGHETTFYISLRSQEVSYSNMLGPRGVQIAEMFG